MKYLQDSFSVPMPGVSASNWENTFGSYIQFRQKKLASLKKALLSTNQDRPELERRLSDKTGLDLWEVEVLLCELDDKQS